MSRPPSSSAQSVAVTEAWIEEIHRSCDRVRLRLLTSDGRPVQRVVSAEDADWLELAPGQIITLLRTASGRPNL